MPCCSALSCTYKHCRQKTPGKSIHRFPFSRPSVLSKWIVNVRRVNWTPSKTSVLCSSHFEEDCFDKTGRYVKLKPDAVPTIFYISKYIKKKRTCPTDRTLASKKVDKNGAAVGTSSSQGVIKKKCLAENTSASKEVNVNHAKAKTTSSASMETEEDPDALVLSSSSHEVNENVDAVRSVTKDHNYFISPRKMLQWQKETAECETLKKEVEYCQISVKRLKEKVESLNLLLLQ